MQVLSQSSDVRSNSCGWKWRSNSFSCTSQLSAPAFCLWQNAAVPEHEPFSAVVPIHASRVTRKRTTFVSPPLTITDYAPSKNCARRVDDAGKQYPKCLKPLTLSKINASRKVSPCDRDIKKLRKKKVKSRIASKSYFLSSTIMSISATLVCLHINIAIGFSRKRTVETK